MSKIAWFVTAVLAASLASCGSDATPPPGVDGGGVTDLGGGGSDARIVCTSDVDCNDGLFCNGREMCAPASASADVRGCVPGDAPCSATETCDETTNDCRTVCDDVDGDGHTAVACGGDDCADADATRYPGATEICDVDDEDCNDTTPGFVDADMDGAGSISCCNGVACGSDCDDTNASIRPGVADGPAMNCNGVDDDCDGTADAACPCADGERRPCYGGPAGTRSTGICADGVTICAGGMLGSECIDDVLPASEICNGLDDDCDGMIDEGVIPRFYVDTDGDGFGQTAMFIDDRCNPPAGYVAAAGDCDDTLPTVNPGQPDLCNGADDDCDGMSDEGAPQSTYYRDDDRDGYGNTATAVMACSAPMGFVPASGDCDDTRAGVSPVGFEICDSAVPAVDEDCDAMRNEGCTCVDGTTQPCGGGTPVRGACRAGVQRCIAGSWAGCTGNIDPMTLTETCNGIDDDCDSMIDEGLIAASCQADADSDGYGAGPVLTTLCRDAARPGGCPSGYTNAPGDCNDGNGAVRPLAPEICNSIDDDCDGATDETLRATYYRDDDGDGFGLAGSTTTACSTPAGYVSNSTDCNDLRADVNPVAAERCDAMLVDDDCDGTANEGCACVNGAMMACGLSSTSPCRRGTQQCIAGVWTACSGQVDPAPEACNGVDDNCNGTLDDGFFCVFGRTRAGTGAFGTCGSTPGILTCNATCTAETFSPLPPAETCDALDNDCDGTIDDGFTCARSSTGHACTTGCGTVGTRACNLSCTGYGTCTAAGETCNGCDDDADGTRDEGFDADGSDVCYQGQTRGCTTACGTGGSQQCQADCSAWGACRASTETCNGCDDDLDGAVDDGFTCRAGERGPCNTACGTLGERICSAGCGWGTCRSAEECNYCDDDRDGASYDEAGLASVLREWDAEACTDLTTVEVNCPPPGSYAVAQLTTVSGAADRGAIWRPTPITVGYGPFVVDATVWAFPPGTGMTTAGNGWAVVLATDEPGALIGNAGDELGVPLTRNGVSIEWRAYSCPTCFPPPEVDAFYVRRLNGAAPGAFIAGGFSGLSPQLPPSAASASRVDQQLIITYTPPNASTGATARLQVRDSDGTNLVDTTSPTLPQVLPGERVYVGITAATSGALTTRYEVALGQGMVLINPELFLVRAERSCDVPDGLVRIVGGGPSGRLEVFHSGDWGTVCDDAFDANDAGVVCRQLGYSTGTATFGASVPDGIGQIWLDDVGCAGTEPGLTSCASLGWGIHNCSHGEDVGVSCTP